MSWQYSFVVNEEVWVDDDDTNVWCDECNEEFDLADEGAVDGDSAFCDDCYSNLFGEDN